jgi:phospholipid/cholesterol/gamma-HCH transport system permease protein
MINPITLIGKTIIYVVDTFGGLGLMLMQTIRWTFRRPFRWRLVIFQMENIGVNSLSIIILTGIFTGMIFAYQMYYGFKPFGAESMTGMVVTLAMARELAPVLGSIMVTARSGSAMAAELGTMQVTEQIDAIQALAVEPMQYLVVPRVLAGALVMPFLCLITIVFSMLGSYFVAVILLGVGASAYNEAIIMYVKLGDVLNGMFKAFIFGIIFSLVGCYKGCNTSGGALGVGNATTDAVVLSCVLILCMDYVLTALTTGGFV